MPPKHLANIPETYRLDLGDKTSIKKYREGKATKRRSQNKKNSINK